MLLARALLTFAVLLLLAEARQAVAQEGNPEGRFQVRERYASEGQAKILSVVFPGLGHLAVGHREKGTALVAAEIVGLVTWLTSHSDYNTQSDQFALEEARYASLETGGGSYEAAEESWRRIKSLKGDADGSHTRRQIFGVVAIGVYGYNLVDALLLGGVAPAGRGRVGVLPMATPERTGLTLVARF
ncbi:MAG: DUF5683 domain-containing protein [Candidatus Latescibacterota bacterium]|nr:DUF5683 domain-containing protein [Candidatus Latescibacterota bacterium]